MNDLSPRPALPRTVAVRKLAAHGQHLGGVIDGAALPRLAEAVSAILGPVAVELRFEPGTSGVSEVHGTVSARVAMVCQRCLGMLTVPLAVPVALGLVRDGAGEQRLPARLDPWIVSDEDGDLYDLAEEELLLALPIVALHDDASCHAAPAAGGDDDDAENPFRILADLKLQR
jgi:uncharacterized protein